MDRKNLTGLFVIGASLFIGMAADLLLRDVSWGINVPLWTALLLLTVHRTLKRRDRRGIRAHWPLAAAATLFAWLFAWRDSATLKALDGTALFTLLALLVARIRFEWSPWQPFSEYAARAGRVVSAALTGALPVVKQDVEWSGFRNDTALGAIRSIGRGLLVALPVLAVFALLLVSADARFERLLVDTFSVNVEAGLLHVAVILGCAWLAAGYLREAAQPDSAPVKPIPYPFALGMTEVMIVLGLVNLLFAAFVWLQIPYLFGGIKNAASGTTYAEYARRGFFELAWVAGLVLPMLLHAHAMLRNAGRGGEKLYRLMALIMVSLIFVIIASSIHRMGLYQNQFGLTELRFYTTAFMCWLAVVFGWFMISVMVGARNRFAFGAFVSGLVVIPILHIANPDAVIVRVNAARAAEHKPFDPDYNGSLSADAVPELLKAIPVLTVECQEVVKADLWGRKAGWNDDWRQWSWSRAVARALLAKLPADVPSPRGDARILPSVPLPLGVPAPIFHVPFTDKDRARFRIGAPPDAPSFGAELPGKDTGAPGLQPDGGIR